MRESYIISLEGQGIIQDFISALSDHERLQSKTLTEYAGDLKHFINWFEGVALTTLHNDPISFHPKHVEPLTLTNYRDAIQNTMDLKPATINRRLITLKRFFEWASLQNIIGSDPSRHVKLLPTEKIRPRQITDQEETDLIRSVEEYGTIRDQTILTIMVHTGLCTMEICSLAPDDIVITQYGGYVIVRYGKRNKQREVPLDPICQIALKKHLATLPLNSPFLFLSEKTRDRLCERALRYIIQKYMKIAQLEELSAHDLRHRFGYKMAETMTPHQLALIMGHDNIDTIMIYKKAVQKELAVNQS